MGTVRFRQASGEDPMYIDVDLSGLNSMAGGYHVHTSPITSGCGAESTGGHWLRDDEYDIGDLATKHGSLSGLSVLSASYVDTDLSLFGEYSIVGRSVVIHYDQAGSPRWVCANIGSPRRDVVAQFYDAGVKGTVSFAQASVEDPVFITTDLSGLNSMAGGYHVHEFPISNGCGADSTGGHYLDADDVGMYLGLGRGTWVAFA